MIVTFILLVKSNKTTEFNLMMFIFFKFQDVIHTEDVFEKLHKEMALTDPFKLCLNNNKIK